LITCPETLHSGNLEQQIEKGHSEHNKILPVADPLPADAATAILDGLKGSFILFIFPGT
jgi:hypothetical protein